MSTATIKQLARFAADRIANGESKDKIVTAVAATLLNDRKSRDVQRFGRALELELQKRGSIEVVVTSARPVSDEIAHELAALLGVKTPRFHYVVDPAVIGGIKAATSERQIDMTVAGQLRAFKQKIRGV